MRPIFSDASKKLRAEGREAFIQSFTSFIRAVEKVQNRVSQLYGALVSDVLLLIVGARPDARLKQSSKRRKIGGGRYVARGRQSGSDNIPRNCSEIGNAPARADLSE